MERTLDTVLKSISNPGGSQGANVAAVSRSPSPSAQTVATRALLASPSPPPTSTYPSHGSPKLHSLPDNSLNPLGLLAEASLANRRAQVGTSSNFRARTNNPGESPKVGV